MKHMTPEQKKELFPDNTILLGYRGSIAHNMYMPNTDPNSIDDIDLMGVFMAPPDHYLGLKESRETIEKFVDQYDVVNYEFKKFLSLLLKSNPNVLSLLWLRDNHYIERHMYGKMLIENRDLFVSKQAYHSFTGYAYAQLKKMEHLAHKGYMGEKRKALVEKYGYDCYDDLTTEFLTNRGWKKFDEISEKDKLATVNIESGILEFQNYLKRIDKIHTGKMYIVEPYLSKCIITPNHNMLVSPARRRQANNFSNKYEEALSDWNLLSMSEIISGHRSHYHVRKVAVANNKKDYNVSNDYLKLAGLFLSDGTINFRDGDIKSIRVTQKKPNNGFYDAIRSLMSVYGFREYNYKKENVWNSHDKKAKEVYNDFGHSKNKHLPEWIYSLSKRQIKLFWEHLMLGDGTKKEQYDVYYTSSKVLADQLQALMVIGGFHCVVDGPYESETKFGLSKMYHIIKSNMADPIECVNFGRILYSNQEKVNKKDGFPVKEIDVIKRRVVCFEVPNSTLITRNNGKVSIHGNCKNAAHCIRLLKMGMEFLTEGRLNVFRDDAPWLLEIKRGLWKLEDVKAEAKRLFELADAAYIKSDLPNEPDYDKVNELCMATIKHYLDTGV